MKIAARCLHCGRDLLLDQLAEHRPGGAACPWCGATVAGEYSALYVQRIRDAERAGAALIAALEVLGETGAGCRIDPGSVLEPILMALRPRGARERPRMGRLRVAA